MFSISVRSISRAISGIICLAIVILLSLQAQFLIPIITEDGSPFTPAARTSSAPQNYYTLLNITVNATERDIKRAYHRQVLFIHPDKLQRLNASVREEGKRRFDAMTQAFEVLTSDRRCKYDLDVMGVGLGRYSRCLEDRWERRRAERARKVAAEHEQEAVREEEREGYQAEMEPPYSPEGLVAIKSLWTWLTEAFSVAYRMLVDLARFFRQLW